MYKILACMVLMFVLNSADKNLMLIKDTEVTWMSKDNFITLTKISFKSFAPICTNIYIAGTSAAVENLLDIFLRNYPFEYLMNAREYACTGYLMIFSTLDNLTKTMENVPTQNSDTQLLFVIDTEIEDSSKIFNISMYEHANVNIVAKNGLWTLSENHLVPRKFKKIKKYEQLIGRQRILNFQQRVLQVTTDYNRPLSYLNTTVVRVENGVEKEFFVATKGHPEFDGIEVNLLSMIAERLNFTYVIRNRNGPYRYGRLNATGWYGGILGQIIQKEVDIAFGGIWLELPQYAMTNLTTPWTQLDVRFLVPRPKPYISFWALTRPLSLEVWFGVFVMIMTNSLYVYSRSWLNPRVQKRYRSFTLTWSLLMAQLLGLSVTPKWRGFKLQFQLWNMIGVHIVTAYSSSLAARLASSDYEKRIDTAQQFIESNLTWGREGLPPNYSGFKNHLDPWKSQFLKYFESEANEEERHRKILKGNYAIFGRVVGSIFFPENEIRDEDLKGYRVMKEHVGKYYVSLAVQPWLLNPCNEVLTWLRETGFVDYHLRDVIGRRTTAAHREVLIEYDVLATEPRVLGLRPLAAAFSILAIGLLISMIVFYYEITSFNKGKLKKNHLIKTQKRKECCYRKTTFLILRLLDFLKFK